MTQKNPCQGKHREFGNFAKTQGIWFAQVVNSLILKIMDIAIFALETWFGLLFSGPSYLKYSIFLYHLIRYEMYYILYLVK